MKRLIIPVVVVLAALVLAGGFFLPSFISQLGDRQTIGKLTITDGSGVSYETKSELKIIDRLKMMTNAGRVKLDNGKNMDSGTAYESALLELGKLNSKGIFDFDPASCRLSKSGVAFFIDSADPSKNMIVWDLFIQTGIHTISVAVDDETGKLLSMQYSIDQIAQKKDAAPFSRPPSPADALNIELIGQTVADYYGLTQVRSEPLKNDKYLSVICELSDGQDTVKLVASITGIGFSINI